MALSTTVTIDGLDDAIQSIDDLPDQLRTLLADVLNQGADDIRNDAIGNFDKNGTEHTGLLRTTIDVRQRPSPSDLTTVVGAGGSKTDDDDFDYALAIEFGTRPHFPPVKAITGRVESLDRWVELKAPADVKENQTQEQANIQKALNIARKQDQEGTDAQPFLRPAAKKNKPRIKKAIIAAFDRLG